MYDMYVMHVEILNCVKYVIYETHISCECIFNSTLQHGGLIMLNRLDLIKKCFISFRREEIGSL